MDNNNVSIKEIDISKVEEFERTKKQILTYIKFVSESGLGKKKALEYLYKYVENIL